MPAYFAFLMELTSSALIASGSKTALIALLQLGQAMVMHLYVLVPIFPGTSERRRLVMTDSQCGQFGFMGNSFRVKRWWNFAFYAIGISRLFRNEAA